MTCTRSRCINTLGLRSKKSQKVGSESYSHRYAKSQVCAPIDIHAHPRIYSHVLFTTFQAHKHSYLFSNTAQSRKKTTTGSSFIFYWCETVWPRSLGNSSNLLVSKQCFIWGRIAMEGIPHTAVCTCTQIHTESRPRNIDSFKILQVITY